MVTPRANRPPCDAVYEYDGRDRLTRQQVRAGKDIRDTLDQPANLLGDATVRAGNVTTESRYGTSPPAPTPATG